MMVGYNKLSYFCRSFREYYGISPEKHRTNGGTIDARRIKEKFWNMKFRRKLLFSHTMVCVIPIVILGFFCYQQVLHLMMEREKESLSQSMKQAEQTVDAELESYGNIVTYLSMHSQIQDYLKKDYQNTSKDYYVQHEFYMNLLAPTMLNLGNTA